MIERLEFLHDETTQIVQRFEMFEKKSKKFLYQKDKITFTRINGFVEISFAVWFSIIYKFPISWKTFALISSDYYFKLLPGALLPFVTMQIKLFTA